MGASPWTGGAAHSIQLRSSGQRRPSELGQPEAARKAKESGTTESTERHRGSGNGGRGEFGSQFPASRHPRFPFFTVGC